MTYDTADHSSYFDPTHLLIPFNTIVDQLNRMFRWFTVSFFLISWHVSKKWPKTKTDKEQPLYSTAFNMFVSHTLQHCSTFVNNCLSAKIMPRYMRPETRFTTGWIAGWNSISVHGQLHVPVYMTDARYAPEMKLVPGWVSSRSLRQGWDPHIPGRDKVTAVIISIVTSNSWHSM